jgi:hypothetical protein
MQKLIRRGIIDIQTGLAFATNPGNLRLELSDLIENGGHTQDVRASSEDVLAEAEVEIER